MWKEQEVSKHNIISAALWQYSNQLMQLSMYSVEIRETSFSS